MQRYPRWVLGASCSLMSSCPSQVKCEYYWLLDAQPWTHRHLQVTLEGEQVMEDWTIWDVKLWHVRPTFCHSSRDPSVPQGCLHPSKTITLPIPWF